MCNVTSLWKWIAHLHIIGAGPTANTATTIYNNQTITIKSFPTLSSDPVQGFIDNGTFSLTISGGNWLNMPGRRMWGREGEG